jgi:acetoacetyl-CoA synthetase
MTAADILWQPGRRWVEDAEITKYLRWLEQEQGRSFATYMEAWRWSVTELGDFWSSIWSFFAVDGERGAGPALAAERMPGAEWFPGAHVNYAEHLVRRASATAPALVAIGEDDEPHELSWEWLAAEAGALAQHLRAAGVGRGDRVVAYVNNIPHAVVGLIATASLGAIWSACSPDYGTTGVVSRFAQLRPKVLIAVDGYRFGGRAHHRGEQVRAIAAGLPGLEQVIWIDQLDPEAAPSIPAVTWRQATADAAPLRFERVPFDHPLWVLYSSGTTGTPKGIVQGHGGILLEHLKAVRFGLDLKPSDRLLLLASTSWMVWNVMVSGLLAGATVVLLDGNAPGPDLRRVWRTVEQVGVTVLGVGAGFLHAAVKAGRRPRAEHDLRTLREIMSTGSPLSDAAYRWMAEDVGPDVWINSSSGGTDVCSTFVGGCPLLPVRSGRLQVPGLGVAVAAWDQAGQPLTGRVGELVVTRPMPSMPLHLWGDADGSRYHDSYFDTYAGVWRHGDFISFDADGSSVIHGRSDSTLNRNGIRIGTAEIYAVVEALPSVAEALVVGLEDGDDYSMLLFVELAADPGGADDVEREIAAAIRRDMSPRHVPDEVVVVPGIPHTRTGKKLEVPVKRILQGQPVGETLDVSAVDRPDLLAPFQAFAARRADRRPAEARP